MAAIDAASSAIVIREATSADALVLADIERRTPLMVGDSTLAIDRGADYFAAARLMEAATVFLAEVDGVAAAVQCGALHPVLLGGVGRQMLYIHHVRILPQFQRRGLGRLFSAKVRVTFQPHSQNSYWYIAADNAVSQGFARAAKNRWTFRPVLVGIDTRAQAGPMVGRPATPADGPRIVELLNAAHWDEEMFLPYTVESLTARLERAPAQYSWPHVWLYGAAVVGVWPEGESICVLHTDPSGAVTTTRGAAVLDFGCAPTGANDLVALLRAWCGWLAPRDMVELSIFTSPHTWHHDSLTDLGRVSPFDFWTPELPQPETAEQRGLYVDHVYF